MLDELFEKELDALLLLTNKLRDAEINAGACGTDRDHRKARELRHKFEDDYLAFLKKYKTALARKGI